MQRALYTALTFIYCTPIAYVTVNCLRLVVALVTESVYCLQNEGLITANTPETVFSNNQDEVPYGDGYGGTGQHDDATRVKSVDHKSNCRAKG